MDNLQEEFRIQKILNNMIMVCCISLLVFGLVFFLHKCCEKPKNTVHYIDKYKTKIDTITIYKDKLKVLKKVLNTERKILIHDTLKCDSLYQIVQIQDTLIKVDSILITELMHDTIFLEPKQTIHTKTFIFGFGAGYILGRML